MRVTCNAQELNSLLRTDLTAAILSASFAAFFMTHISLCLPVSLHTPHNWLSAQQKMNQMAQPGDAWQYCCLKSLHRSCAKPPVDASCRDLALAILVTKHSGTKA